MKNALLTLQVISALVTIVLIIIQSKGTGIGSAFGGDMGFYGTKRGAERLLFGFTIVMVTLFVISSLVSLFIS